MVTFIIPSVGRSTLQRAIDSLHKQTITDWKAVICFDRVKPTIKPTDKISVMTYDSPTPIEWRAGAIRNYMLPKVTTEFVGLLDDDDSLTPNYIQKLSELKNLADVVVFQMQYDDGKVIPRCYQDIAFRSKIGISFAFRAGISVKFMPVKCEDYYFLAAARQRKYRVIFSQNVTYLVKH